MTSKAGTLNGWTVLVTGATGFIGRSLVPHLESRGACVLPWARTGLSGWELGEVAERVRESRGSRRACIHLAGMAHVERSEQDPGAAFQANVESVAGVFELGKELGIERFILPSTARVWRPGEREAYSELDEVNPIGIYGTSKVTAELWARDYARKSGIPAWVVRLSNVYGPESSMDTVVGAFLQQVRRQRSIHYRGGASVRDFICVTDVAEGLARLVETKPPSGADTVNLSTGVGTSIRELAETLGELAGVPVSELEGEGKGSPSDRLVLSNARLFEALGWRPSVGVREGLKACLEAPQR